MSRNKSCSYSPFTSNVCPVVQKIIHLLGWGGKFWVLNFMQQHSICIIWHTIFLKPINTTWLVSLGFRHFWAVQRNPFFKTWIIPLHTSFVNSPICSCGHLRWWSLALCNLLFNVSIRVTELYTMALRGSLFVSWPFVINKDILIVYSLTTWIFVTFSMSAFNKSHLFLILYLSIALRIKFMLLWKWAYLYFKRRHNILLSTSSFFKF